MLQVLKEKLEILVIKVQQVLMVAKEQAVLLVIKVQLVYKEPLEKLV